MARDASSGVRRAEVIAALSTATDLAMGQPMEFALQSCVLATRLGKAFGVDAETLSEIYYHALLRYIGCNAETHTMAALLGDEIDFRREYALIDPGRAAEIVGLVFTYLRRANSSAGLIGMLANVAHGLIASQRVASDSIASHCEVAQRLAARLGLGTGVQRNLGQIYERWDGRGLPGGLTGEAIAPAVRVVSLAQDAIVLRAAFGADEASARLQARSGSVYEPRLVSRLIAESGSLTASLDRTTCDVVLSLEPAPIAMLSEAELDEACLAMADFADLKTPYSVGHSRAVSALAAEAARRCGLPEADAIDLRRAGLLHDIGQVGVPARIWLKAGALNDSEREQARLHAYYGERVLSRPPQLARLGTMIGQHHERCDGSGYHRGVRAGTLSAKSRILAAVEAYQNKIEPRPHRPALSPQAAADALRREAREGRLDGEAVAAVLEVAGHRVRARKDLTAGLTEREIGVLRAIARGQSTKEIARSLAIAPKTVDNHTQSIFAKIGARTRGGATLFAIEHGLSDP